MTDRDDFLTRWSRRKRQAAAGAQVRESTAESQVPDAPAAEQPVADTVAPSQVAADIKEAVFDLSKLPSIGSITAETDIRMFLVPGVPAELRLAALRRAWSADPKVRDFVGLADYDFDFHTPGAIAGFGPLEMTDDVRRELARIVTASEPQPQVGSAESDRDPTPTVQGSEQASAEAGETPAAPDPTGMAKTGEAAGTSDHVNSDQDEVIAGSTITHCNKDVAALQQEQPNMENLQRLAKRGHGGALPQ